MVDAATDMRAKLDAYRSSNQRYLGYLYLDGQVKSLPNYQTDLNLIRLSAWLTTAAQINAPASYNFSNFEGRDYKHLEYYGADDFWRNFVFKFNDKAAYYSRRDLTPIYSGQYISNYLADSAGNLFVLKAESGQVPTGIEIGNLDVFEAVAVAGNPHWAWAGGPIGQIIFNFPNPIQNFGDFVNWSAVSGRVIQEMGGELALTPLATSSNPADRVVAATLKMALDFEDLYRMYAKTKGGISRISDVRVDGLTPEEFLQKRLKEIDEMKDAYDRGVSNSNAIVYRQIGSIVGTSLGQYLAGDNAIKGVAYSSVLGEIGERLAAGIQAGNITEAFIPLATTQGLSAFGSEVAVRAGQATIGAVSS